MTKAGVRGESATTQRRLLAFVPRVAADWIRNRPDERFIELDGTLAFVDLSGFTAMSERLARLGRQGAEEVTDVIERTFAELLAVAYDAGGSLLKFGGDALLLLFTGGEGAKRRAGGPIENHAARACGAAVAMRRTLRQIGPIQTSAGPVRLRMSVGLHSGPFTLFLVGSSHRELLVTGPAATRTVEMESAAGAGEVLASEQTVAGAPGVRTRPGPAGGFLVVDAPAVPAPAVAPLLAHASVAALVPASLRAYLTSGADEPEHRRVTVGFVHFDGTDALSPRALANRLESLVAAAQAAAESHGVVLLGTDIDRDGGKLILTAGAPDASDNDEERMLRALRVILDARAGIDVRAGVHCGAVFAGCVGPPYRRTYTVMGDAVNTAARVMARAGHGELLATRDVLAPSETVFDTEELEAFAVKGKSLPLVAFRVGRPAGTRQERASRVPPLVGRDEELEAVVRALRSGGVVEVAGEGGMGKSRLLAEASARLTDMRVIPAMCLRYEAATPFYAARQVLEQVVGRSLARTVRRVAPDLQPWLPLLALLLGVRVAATREVDELDDDFVRAKLHEVVASFLSRALTEPAVLTFDDAQWMDEASGALVGHLASRGLCAIAVFRRPGDGGFSPRGAALTLRLRPIVGDDAARLATFASGGALLPQEATELASRAGGSPLFLQELAKSGGGVSGTVEALIAARIDRLHPRHRRALRALSVVDGFSLDEASEVTGDPLGRETLLPLVEFVDTRERRVRFRQHLYQEVAYAGLPFRTRRAMHERAASLLERAGDDRVEAQSLHLFSAGRFDAAWVASRAAGRRARERLAFGDAAAFFRRALACAGHVDDVDLTDTWHALGESLHRAGRLQDAGAAYRMGRRAAGPTAFGARLHLREGGIEQLRGRLDRALRLFRRGARVATGFGEERALLTAAVASIRHRQGRAREAGTLARDAFRRAQDSGVRSAIGHAAMVVQMVLQRAGDHDADDFGRLAVEVFEEAGELRFAANVLNNLGVAAYSRGDWNGAVELYARAKSLHERAGNVLGTAAAASNLGEILADQGRHAEARTELEDAIGVFGAAGAEQFALIAGANLARVTASLDVLESSLGRLRAMGADDRDVAVWTAETRLRAGDARGALEVAGTHPRARLVAGRARIALGDRDGARVALASAIEEGGEFERGHALVALSSLAEGGDADKLAAEGREILDRLGVAWA